MIDIKTYIREGFYSNIGGSLSRLIKEIPDKITERSYLHEIGNLRFFFDAEKTRLYKELKELFFSVPSFKTTYIFKYKAGRLGGHVVTETLRYEFIKNNTNDCMMRSIITSEDHPGEETIETEETYTDVKDLLCNFVSYLRNRRWISEKDLAEFGKTFTFEILK